MKTFKYYATVLLVFGVLLSGLAYGLDSETQDSQRTLRKPLVLSALNFDGNRIDNDLMNNGMIVSQLVSGRSGMSWPAGNGTQTIYASGVWLGAKVDNQVRVSAGEFAGELVGGPWGSDPDDPAHKLYKVSKSDLADPLASDDFQNWPAHQGAPFVDNNGNGTYEPLPGGPDMPDFIGDQVIWAVMNDGDPTAHSVFQTAPMGLEVQMTVFGFDRPDAFGDMMFVKELIINRGEETLDDMIIGLWSDPDLGDAGDDFVGCDTTLGMGIVYNDGDDVNFAGYSGGTPAAGYDFFQGPMVPMAGETAYMFGRYHEDMMNLKMTSFTKYINPDPVYYDPNNAEEAYNYMSGFLPDGSPFPFVASGGTPFIHPGDPTKDTGPGDTEYVDSDLHASEDRRFLMNAGPFTMAPGDSQEVVFGIFMAAAGSALDSYLYLKEVDILAQLAYDINFALPPSPPNPEVAVTTFDDEIILSWDTAAEIYKAEDQVDKDPDGNSTEFVFEGYNVYQLETLSGSGNVKRLATYDLVNGITEIYDDVFNTEFGEVINRRVQFGEDSGIKRSIRIDADALNNNGPLITNRAYYFAVTAYGYNEYGIPKTLESPMNIMEIRPQFQQTWAPTDTTAEYGTIIAATHTEGPSDGESFARVVDPTIVTGDDYEMFFTDEEYYLDVDGVWKNVNSGGKEALQRILDCQGSLITFSAMASENVGTYDLMFNFEMHCGSNWVDGILLDFPAGVTINSWGAIGDCSYGAGSGQDCSNLDGTWDAATNSILWGNSNVTGFGAIEGDQHWTVNVQPASFPIDVGYDVYDDGYDGSVTDATGTASATELGYQHVTISGWYARNLNTGEIVTPHSTIQSGVAADNIVDGVFVPGSAVGDETGPTAEGLQVIVETSGKGIKQVSETDQNDVILDLNVGVYPPSLGTTGYILSHRDHANTAWLGRTHDRYDLWDTDDVIINFAEESVAWDYIEETVNGTVPYSVYRKKFPDGEMIRLFAGYWDTDINGAWSVTEPWGDYGKPGYEPIYAWQGYDIDGNEISYDHTNEAQYVADNSLLTSANTTWGGGTGEFQYPFLTATMMVLYLDGSTPPWGNKIWIITNKPLMQGDVFTFSTDTLKGNTIDYSPNKIKAWPNPYFGYNPEESHLYDRQIHFTHLPETGKCIIRIFDLAGTLVRRIVHHNGTQFEIWNLANDKNVYVASGMYIVHIETEEGEKILKLAVIQPS